KVLGPAAVEYDGRICYPRFFSHIVDDTYENYLKAQEDYSNSLILITEDFTNTTPPSTPGSGGGTYTNATPTPSSFGGISSGTTFNKKTMQEMFDMLLYPYMSPLVSLSSSPSGGVREYGNVATSVTLSASTTKRTNGITSVAFLRDNSSVYIVNSPFTNGGTQVWTDTNILDTSRTYNCQVSDGNSTVTSNTVTFTFVYPFYYGVGSVGLNESGLKALTKDISAKGNKSLTTSPSSQVYYFAYPQSYGALSDIIDQNGFSIKADYTIRTVSMTMLDSTSQNYTVYEFKNQTTQTNFLITYRFS
ncbi:MAG: hypothetical protein Q8880_12635, partial [Bacteroidota bacterium]|nr:hypothetical protein [Bacteroidota bacterium]